MTLTVRIVVGLLLCTGCAGSTAVATEASETTSSSLAVTATSASTTTTEVIYPGDGLECHTDLSEEALEGEHDGSERVPIGDGSPEAAADWFMSEANNQWSLRTDWQDLRLDAINDGIDKTFVYVDEHGHPYLRLRIAERDGVWVQVGYLSCTTVSSEDG